MVMETLQIELHGATHAFPVLELRDRRKRGNPKKKWALVRATEILLFDVHDRSRGRFAAHLAKCSMDDAVLVAERAAVNSGILTDEELGAGKKPPPRVLPPPPSNVHLGLCEWVEPTARRGLLCGGLEPSRPPIQRHLFRQRHASVGAPLENWFGAG